MGCLNLIQPLYLNSLFFYTPQIQAMATTTRGKKKTKCPNLHTFIGEANEMLDSELPTLRQCFQYGMLIEDRRIEPLTQRQKFTEVVEKVRSIWYRVNPLLPLQIVKHTIDRLVNEWTKAKTLSKTTGKVSEKNELSSRLDKLFDICKCKCPILSCSQSLWSGCDFEDKSIVHGMLPRKYHQWS